MNNLEITARRAAPVVALLITAALLLAALAFRLGHLLGSAVHARNDQLAAAMVRLTVGEAPASKAVVTAQPCAPAVHPLAALAADLERLTSRQLQAITGSRRRVAKQQLIAAALVLS